MITLDNALDAIAQIEGPAWLEWQDRGEGHTVKGATRLRDEQLARVKLALETETDPADRAHHERRMNGAVEGGEIYGLGGWNRYFVRIGSGEVFISAHHASSGSIEKAQALGMGVWQ